MAMIPYINTACYNCRKHSEYKAKLHCLNVAEEEIFDIFKLLSIPIDEQDILVQIINKENTCWDNLRGLLYKLVRNKND